MKMNYSPWFYDQHKYRTGVRNGVLSYNDTKWVDINTRYKKLNDMTSTLLSEQPYGVIGNKSGFNKLINLLGRSNYTFDDIDESLIDTYRVSLRNAMSRMLVNTQAVMFKCNNTTSKNVVVDKFTHNYIIDAPYNQLHFGDRDEFIRQKISKMHEKYNDYYMPLSDLITNEFSDILGFTILCTTNGFISNDCYVAFSDKGLKFKIGWLYSSDVEFIIYKLDESFVKSYTVDSNYITSETIIPYTVIDKPDISLLNKPCILDIYDPNFYKSLKIPPNFGVFTEKGLVIKNIQGKTLSDITLNKTKSVKIIAYIFNYLHEVPNTYPACNYYDIQDSRRVVVDESTDVTDVNNSSIVSTQLNDKNNLEICTPPISLDRSTNLSFQTISNCLSLNDYLSEYTSIFKNIGITLNRSDLTMDIVEDNIKEPLNEIYPQLELLLTYYMKGAILTSLVSSTKISKFQTLVSNINKMRKVSNIKQLQSFAIDEYYEDNYQRFIDDITEPFTDNSLSNFVDLKSLSNNYFSDENVKVFNRPVSEQCFITLKYNREVGCWLFDLPDIQHFKGIGNTFYINDNLKGNEIFKFFVLYTDTEAPSEKEIDPLSLEQIFDFDQFNTEIEKHIGFIRYWYIENKLMKISKVIYNKYDSETVVQVLSKILKRKIDGSDIIDVYGSDINYEPSNSTSDNLDYDETSDRGPFSINFLFYTLSMLYDNDDKLQEYFLTKLTDNKYYNRYTDIDISDMFVNNETYPVNYSQFCTTPIGDIDVSSSLLPADLNTQVYYGLPYVMDNNHLLKFDNLYNNTFNVYEANTKYYMLDDNGLNKSYYMSFNNPTSSGFVINQYHDDIYITKLITQYLTHVHSYMSYMQTNYKLTYNQEQTVQHMIETINKDITNINEYVTNNHPQFSVDTTSSNINSIINNNPVISMLNSLSSIYNSLNYFTFQNKKVTVVEFFNKLLSLFKRVYINTGFDNYALRRIRALYIYLKKINNVMNPYVFKKWLMNLDDVFLSVVSKTITPQENYTFTDYLSFDSFYKGFIAYKNMALPILDELISLIDNNNVYTTHILPLSEYCNNIIQNYIFDLFIIDTVTYNLNDTEYSACPLYAVLSLDSQLHFSPNKDRDGSNKNVRVILQPTIEHNKSTSKYKITGANKICEYAFFDGSLLSDCNISFMDENDNLIYQTTCSVTFKKVASTADNMENIDQLLNNDSQIFDFLNIHQINTSNTDGFIANQNQSELNYELMIGNHYKQLTHKTELLLNPDNMQQSPCDRVIIENSDINNFVNKYLFGYSDYRVYFKPSQILHIPLTDDGVMKSIGGKFFENQTIYLSTPEDYIFSATITTIDHSMNKGFLEAVVNPTSKWFQIDDKIIMTKYLTTDITCTILDDNIRNFLDEFSNNNYTSFSNSEYNTNAYVMDENFDDCYSLPGDPIYVSNNTDFVYTRLNAIFNELVPNRFIDDEHKKYKFIYIGYDSLHNINNKIQIKMINHNMNTLTNPEMFPVLREEPNDHETWKEEIIVFSNALYASQMTESNQKRALTYLIQELARAKTQYEYDIISAKIDTAEREIKSAEEFQKKMTSLINEQEEPTKWYNVRAYDDTLIYIANGRAKLSYSFISNTRDLLYTDKLEVFLYDWENKKWLDPSTYSILRNNVSDVQIDEVSDYKTDDILHSISIIPTSNFSFSKKILIYFAYKKSDIYDSITLNSYTCKTRFKPILSLGDVVKNEDLYKEIYIRKHFDGNETYQLSGYNTTDDFSSNGYYIERYKSNGKYTNSAIIRMCDLTLTNNDIAYSYDKFNLYIRNPFKDVITDQTYKTHLFETYIRQPIISFVNNTRVKLISLQNDQLSSYDGNISNIMFEGVLTYVGKYEDTQYIVIDKTTLPNTISGTFVCTVFRDDTNYQSYGGLIEINVTNHEENLFDSYNKWIKIPEQNMKYYELPDQFIIKPKVELTGEVSISFKNQYIKNIDENITVNNSSLNNPFEFYYDTKNETRLPISNVVSNKHNERLILDKTINTNIQTVKTTYISICRYSLKEIPVDGFIDVTGYIPTPLSRDRYEFWINGRQITNTEDLIILSPTSFQICNSNSLKNFELIELVDDTNDDSAIIKEGNVYTSLTGQTFSSYRLAILSNQIITKQDVRFMFNGNQHKQIQDYSDNIIANPNNKDIEDDILKDIIIDNSSTENVTYPRPTSLGIDEIPNEDIITLFDSVWNIEAITNPLFDTTHRNNLNLINNEYLVLKIKHSNDNYDFGFDTTGMFVIYTSGMTSRYFTLYVSETSTSTIDDTTNTLLIIPLIKTGIFVLIDKSYRGKWLHSTAPNCKPIKIQ